MAPLPQLEIRQLSSSRISVRSQADYREAGSVDAVLRFLRTSNGFIHVAPFGCGMLLAEEVSTFHRIPAVLRSVCGVAQINAFWLVSHCQIPAPAVEPADQRGNAQPAFALGMPGHIMDAVAYSWLFIQPSALESLAWHQAGAALSQHVIGPVLCRSRGYDGIETHPKNQQGLIDCTTATNIMKQIAINALPSRSLEAVAFSSLSKEALITPPLYAAVPHCNSSRMMFAFRSIWKGDE